MHIGQDMFEVYARVWSVGALQHDMEFEENYNNPCWAESIPRWPYQNNSYLLIDEQQQLIDPVFQAQYTYILILDLSLIVCMSVCLSFSSGTESKACA